MKGIKEYKAWQTSSFIDQEDRDYLKSIEENQALIQELFSDELKFGTAGMRGIMGVGTNRFNKYLVAKATQAYADILKKDGTETIAIGYDTRNNSKAFAEVAAKVLVANKITVNLFEKPIPVPVLSYYIREKQMAGGIAITASHNPKEYNGYKLYDQTGCQMTPSEMQSIGNAYKKIEELSQIKISKTDNKIKRITTEIDNDYIQKIIQLRQRKTPCDEIKCIYTPLHGTGRDYMKALFGEMGCEHINYVDEQMTFDGDFPTVKIPNPEKIESYDLAIKKAKEIDADIILSTDPDCDRVGIMIKNEEDYQVLNGNQIGVLLIDYLMTHRKKEEKEAYIVKTIVTSSLGDKIANAYDAEVIDVLTGFKYIGEQMTKRQADESQAFVLGYEESQGYLSGMHARDKDGVNAVMLLLELADTYKKQGKSILKRLEEVYEKYGYFIEETEDIKKEGLKGQEEIKAIMAMYRQKSIKEIAKEKVKRTDYKNDETGLPKENVLKYVMASDSWIAVRPSGTEPKIKFYYSAQGKTKEEAEQKLEQMKQFIRSQNNG